MRWTAFGAGVLGLLICSIGLILDPRQALTSYLVAYTAGLGIALGALALVMIGHVTGARWFVALRPYGLAVAATLPLFALLFLPLVAGLRELYPWAAGSGVAPELQRQLANKAVYLNVPFFLIRAAVYFAVWIALAISLGRPSARGGAISAVGLPALGITMTFAAFDWMMSLSPTWFSTIYGLYFFAGGFVGALALMAVIAAMAERSGRLRAMAMTDRYHALGTLLLTFVLFWAYVAYSQLLIIWIADIPVEVAWYVPRMRGSWAALGMTLIVGNFALPFLALLFRTVTTRGLSLAAVGGWLLVMHFLDVYWLIMPELHPDGVHPHWLDLGAVAAVGGLMLAWGSRRLAQFPEAVSPATVPVLADAAS